MPPPWVPPRDLPGLPGGPPTSSQDRSSFPGREAAPPVPTSVRSSAASLPGGLEAAAGAPLLLPHYALGPCHPRAQQDTCVQHTLICWPPQDSVLWALLLCPCNTSPRHGTQSSPSAPVGRAAAAARQAGPRPPPHMMWRESSLLPPPTSHLQSSNDNTFFPVLIPERNRGGLFT